MTTANFEEALRKSVIGLDQSYQAAEAELYSQVEQATQAVANFTKGYAKLVLIKDEYADGDYFRLIIESTGPLAVASTYSDTTYYRLAAFELPPKGYPIKLGR